MKKYIEVEKLKEEIERKQRKLALLSNTEQADVRRDCALQNGVYSCILDLINSLQEDQPEVELEKEIDEIWNPRFNLGWDEHSALSMNHDGFVHIARHFYELGLKARKEE